MHKESQELSNEDTLLQQQAFDYINDNKKGIIEHVAGEFYPADETPVSIFMAGSPGAGKTEFSKRLIEVLVQEFNYPKIVRIDADDIRDLLPNYNGRNSYVFHGPASKMVNKIHDYTLKKKKNFILDGTFSNQSISFKNIERSLGKKRKIIVAYIYQDPIKAWEFTKKREELEGRHIRKEDFIRQFFTSKENVTKAKTRFGINIDVWLIIKDYDDPGRLTFKLNVDNIDSYIKKEYNINELESLLN